MPSVSLKDTAVVVKRFQKWNSSYICSSRKLATEWGVSSSPYLWANITVLAVGIWAIADKQSVDAIFMYLVMLFISIIIDIVGLSLTFQYSQHSGFAKFSVGMAIVNLILKPFVILLLYQMYKDRGGEYNINFGNSTTYDQVGEDGNEQGSAATFQPPLITKS